MLQFIKLLLIDFYGNFRKKPHEKKFDIFGRFNKQNFGLILKKTITKEIKLKFCNKILFHKFYVNPQEVKSSKLKFLTLNPKKNNTWILINENEFFQTLECPYFKEYSFQNYNIYPYYLYHDFPTFDGSDERFIRIPLMDSLTYGRIPLFINVTCIKISKLIIFISVDNFF